MVGHGGSSAGSYLADSTSPIPSHCASIVATSTERVDGSTVLVWNHFCRLYFLTRCLNDLIHATIVFWRRPDQTVLASSIEVYIYFLWILVSVKIFKWYTTKLSFLEIQIYSDYIFLSLNGIWITEHANRFEWIKLSFQENSVVFYSLTSRLIRAWTLVHV